MKRILSAFLAGTLLLASISACGTSNSEAAQPQEGDKVAAGTYTVEEKGFNQEVPVKVEVVLGPNSIEAVKVLSHGETEGIGAVAAEKLPDYIVKAQSTDIDVMASATETSKAILAAVNTAITMAGGNPSDFKKQEEAKTSTGPQELEADVVIIGAGGAGLTAAIEAASSGKKVIILEKNEMTGGNTTKSTGGMNAAKTTYQDKNEFKEEAGVSKRLADAKEKYPELAELVAKVEKQFEEYKANPQGYFDSTDLFMLDTLVGGKNLNNPKLVETLVNHTAEAIEWLNKEISAKLQDVSSFGGASVKRIHRPVNEEGKVIPVGSYLVPLLTKAAEAKGVDIYYASPARSIMMKEGRVVGVESEKYLVKAPNVIMATGGFAANLSMVEQYKPSLKGFITTNAPGMTGDGILMAEAVGADVVDMDQIQIHPTVEQGTSTLITEGLRGDGAILVNAEGQRFTDEVSTRDAVSAAEIAQPGGFAYLIVDGKMAKKSNVIQKYIKQGIVTEGADVEALANAIEIDSANLKATLDKWNQALAKGKDEEFGRTSFAEALDEGPFYAIKVAPGVHHTMGGIRINEFAQVLDKQGQVIPGFYAAGEVTGGVHGANRLGGNAVADIIVFGRIAGQLHSETK